MAQAHASPKTGPGAGETGVRAFRAERIFDGGTWHENATLLVENGRVKAIVETPVSQTGIPASRTPEACTPESGGIIPVEIILGTLVPGLIDLQVNGGGGVLFNNSPTPQGLTAICAAHGALGTTALMVTLITDTPDTVDRAIAASRASADQPGFLGLHFEGPHLAQSRKGTHDPALIRPASQSDIHQLLQAAATLDHMICTIAPEAVSAEQVRVLHQAGVTVSLGHTDCDQATARAYAGAGAGMVTHLFNAMSQLGHRSPNLVGAALDDGRLWAGLIADGFHVDDTSMRIALRGKAGPAGLFLVSDAMLTVGTQISEFTLNGRQIRQTGGRLTLLARTGTGPDTGPGAGSGTGTGEGAREGTGGKTRDETDGGTLAGAHICLLDAVRYLHRKLDVPLERALALASAQPAAAMGIPDRGHLRPGAHADFFCLTPELTAAGTWIAGQKTAGIAGPETGIAGPEVRRERT